MPPNRRTLLAWTVPALFLPAAAALIYFHLFSGAAATAVYLGTKLFTLVWPLLAGLRVHGALPPVLRSRCGWGRSLAEGVLSGGAMAAGMLALYLLTPLGGVVDAAEPHIREKVESLGVEALFVPFALFLSLAHSLVEEVFWRWFAFGGLHRAWPLPATHGIAALAFAAHHWVVLAAYFPPLLALVGGFAVALAGMVWSVQMQRTGGLLAPWISHALADGAIMLVAWWVLFG